METISDCTLPENFKDEKFGFDSGVIVVFDSDCVLCSRWIKFILRNEATETIRFASSRKVVGKELAVRCGLKPEDLDLTYLVISRGKALTKSNATLALVVELKKPWCWFQLLRVIPRPLRDGLYDFVARNRLRWFGVKRDCLLPLPTQLHRFLD